VTTSVTRNSLSLANATTYYVCIRAVDVLNYNGTPGCSFQGITTDTNAPSFASTAAEDGPGPGDLEWITTSTSLQGHWTAPTDASPITKYEYCISTGVTAGACSGTIITAWTNNLLATSFTKAGLALLQGTRYYMCVRATDTPGNQGSVCSDGQRVDSVAPTVPSFVLDGLGADVSFTNTGSIANANWGGAAPGADATSGILQIEYCLTTTAAGADCGGSPILGWTVLSPAIGTSLTQSGLSLTDNTFYRTCLRTKDRAGNFSSGVVCSDGLTVDLGPPAAPTLSRDGVAPFDIQWTKSATTLTSNWNASVSADVASYDYCLTVSPTGADCSGTPVKVWTNVGSALTQTSPGLPLVSGTTYYSCVRATDNAGNVGTLFTCSNGQTVDSVNPTAPTVLDGTGADISWFITGSQISANWTGAPGSDALSGLEHYDYCVTTSSSGADCAATPAVGWTAMSPLLSTTLTRSGLSLVNGSTYYVCVRVADVAANTASSCSNGQVLDTSVPTGTVTLTEDASAAVNIYTHPGATANSMFVNGNVAASFWAEVIGPTAASGIQSVTFPSPGGFTTTPAGAITSAPYKTQYSWSSGVANPPAQTAPIQSNSGAITSPTFNIDVDSQ
jgi:hypothetical protein